MGVFDKIGSLFQGDNFNSVRIEKIKPVDTSFEIGTDTIWFENNNIEECIKATQKLGIEHIHLRTDTIAFLNDPRLQHIKGIVIPNGVEDISPLFSLKQLTHLTLPEDIKTTFDFSAFKNLIYLGGTLPKKYVNFNQLTKLKYTRFFSYTKPDLTEFANCANLRKLWIYGLDVESLKGIGNLSNLTQIDLENCRKLTTLDGLSSANISLEAVHLVNCKRLKDASALVKLPKLRQLQLYKVLELDSLGFLTSLTALDTLRLHPTQVGVRNNDYYPLVETLKRLNQLGNLKGWKPLNDYLENKIIIEKVEIKPKSELELIKENLGIMSWTEKSEHGLKQYSKKNCQKAETIILDLVKQLETAGSADLSAKEGMIKSCVLKLNDFNNSLDGSFIETGEREELCDLLDNIADAAGLNVEDYPDGIASQWRDW